jgi:preprotein translocase subunit SecE
VARSSRTRKRSADYQAPAQASVSERARQRRQAVRPVAQPKSQTGARRETRGGVRAFAAESWGELKKVEWPGRRQLLSATVVVIIAVAIVGAYLWLADEAFSRLVRDVLLKL